MEPPLVRVCSEVARLPLRLVGRSPREFDGVQTDEQVGGAASAGRLQQASVHPGTDGGLSHAGAVGGLSRGDEVVDVGVLEAPAFIDREDASARCSGLGGYTDPGVGELPDGDDVAGGEEVGAPLGADRQQMTSGHPLADGGCGDTHRMAGLPTG